MIQQPAHVDRHRNILIQYKLHNGARRRILFSIGSAVAARVPDVLRLASSQQPSPGLSSNRLGPKAINAWDSRASRFPHTVHTPFG
jgi:hypothetical protein